MKQERKIQLFNFSFSFEIGEGNYNISQLNYSKHF